jgi:HEPN domain-containing protein
MKRATREWLRKAEADIRGARSLSRNRPPLHDLVCFHCQQCAEKYLKAMLEELGIAVAKTHNLDQLLPLLQPHHPTLRSLRRGLEFLSDFAVDTRYPGNWASKRQATSALRWAERVRTEARTILGLRPPRPRRKK